MKKLFFLLTIFISGSAIAQPQLSTVPPQTLTFTGENWLWQVGKYGEGRNGETKRAIRRIREIGLDTVAVYGPVVSRTKQITVDSIPAEIVVAFYRAYMNCHFSDYWNFGTNHTLRLDMLTKMRALANAILQGIFADIDAHGNTRYDDPVQDGIETIFDN